MGRRPKISDVILALFYWFTNIYGDQHRALAEYHIDYVDGTHEVITTDESWLTTTGKFKPDTQSGKAISDAFTTVHLAVGSAPVWVCANAIRAAYATRYVQALIDESSLNPSQVCAW